MTENRFQNFTDRYARGNMPWDSGITPPEIRDLLAERPPGAALDLGCGSGTVMRDLLRAGWRADGVDFVARAIELAREKLADFPPDAWRLACGDVTRLDSLSELRPSYDLIIDIGCGHSIDKSKYAVYARCIARRLRAGGDFMLYASHPRPESTVGWTPKQVDELFGPLLELHWEQRGDDVAIGAPSSWYRWRKRP